MLASKFQQIKLRYNELNSREQRMVMIGAIAVLIFIGYQFVLSPLTNKAANLRKQMVADKKTLAWMESTDQAIQAKSVNGATTAKPTTPVALMSALQVAIMRAGLNAELKELKQTSNDSVNLRFSKVPFDRVMKMVLSVMNEQKAAISQMSVATANEPGLVDITVIFSS